MQINEEAQEKLVRHIYEYLVHIGAPKAAQSLLSEIRWEKNISLGDPPGFLHSWWAVFWDLYCAAPERRLSHNPSNEAKAFHDYGFVDFNYSSGSQSTRLINSGLRNASGRSTTGAGLPTYTPHSNLNIRSTIPSQLQHTYPQQPHTSVIAGQPYMGSYYHNTMAPGMRRPQISSEYIIPPNQPMISNNSSDFSRLGHSNMNSRPPNVGMDQVTSHNYGRNYRGPPPYSAIQGNPNHILNSQSNTSRQGQFQPNPRPSNLYFPSSKNCISPKIDYPKPTGPNYQQNVPCTRGESVYTTMKPVKESTLQGDYSHSAIYESLSRGNSSSVTSEDCVRNIKRSPASDNDSTREENSGISSFSLADYRRFLENDSTESVAIMKIKESMQEEAKKFEKDSNQSSYAILN